MVLVMQSEKRGVKIDPTLGLQGLKAKYFVCISKSDLANKSNFEVVLNPTRKENVANSRENDNPTSRFLK